MKTTILTLIAAATLTLSTSAFASATTETVLPNITPIAKIEAHGNVEVFVTTGTKDGVKVYDDYYATTALVQEDKGVLRVTNYDKNEKLIVEVTVTQLQNIAAYDNAVIKSDKLALVDLKVDLYNQAYAGLNLNSYAANINVNDQAKADLTGSVDEYSLTYSYGATVNRTELAAVNIEEIRVAPAMNLKGRFRNRA
jgi:hypothetical protein